MMIDINRSKEEIRSRMLRHAQHYWDIKTTEDLDPVVKLLVEALATELYSVSNRVADTQVRMLEKIAGLLAPDYLTTANPAHGLLHAMPAEPIETLDVTTSFVTQRKIQLKPNDATETNVDIYFTPVDTVRLTDIQLRFIKTGSDLFEIDPAYNKQLVARSASPLTAESNTLWLGLNVHASITNLNGMYFCFDTKDVAHPVADNLYQLLPLARWQMGNKEMKTIEGLSRENGHHLMDENDLLERNAMAVLENDIRTFYDRRYITITGNADFDRDSKITYPLSFETSFTKDVLTNLAERLVWIRVTFPASMPAHLLTAANVYLNTFPVMNRRLTELHYRLRGGSNIIPLKAQHNEQFLSVRSLSDGSHQYKPVHFRAMEDGETGSFTLRNGGVERFDGRNAKEMIGYLLELLRSESAAFVAYGYDFISTTLKELNQRMVLIEQRTRGLMNNTAEVPNYIIVRPFDGQELMYATYWTSLAETGNTIRSGTRFQLAKGAKLKGDSMQLMTGTTGGRNRLKPEERLAAFRYGMMTRNRIVTKEDLRNFCFYELGNRVKDVLVQKGVEISPLPNHGFTRTLRVIIVPSETQKLASGEWETLLAQLRSKLEGRSGVSIHYRVSLQDTL